jgi:signal transduction histidine kinase
MVDQILTNAKQLLAMIDQILTFSKIEAGYLAIQRKSLNLVHVTRAVTTELQTAAAQKNLTLTVQSDLSSPQIVTDPTGLQQILFTLIANAVKFTASGEIKVMLEGLGLDRVRITVRDTGIGIEATDLEHIFEPFRQVDQSTTRHFEGIGLGLAIAAALVQQLQGSITVTSAPDQGSEFRVELPRQMTDSTSPQRETSQIPVH